MRVPLFRSLAATLPVIFLLAGCSQPPAQPVATDGPPRTDTAPLGPAPQSNAPAPAEPKRARILAVGDLLMHLPVTYSAKTPDGWDFTRLFSTGVQREVLGADYAIANLETTLAGAEFALAGYPGFNTPPEFARDLKKIGFDLVTTANNHALDMGPEAGLINTLNTLDHVGLAHTGTSRNQEEQGKILVVELKPGIKAAVLSYTMATNGVPLPKAYSVNLLDPVRMVADVQRARAIDGVDLVIVAPHWGVEYQRLPNGQQRDLADQLFAAGADILLGSHPHVIQPVETRVVARNGKEHKVAVIWSLGNFIANQHGESDAALYRESGLMLVVDVVKEDGRAQVERAGFIPTYAHLYYEGGQKRIRTIVAESALKDCETKADPLLTARDCQRIKASDRDTTGHAAGSPDVRLWAISDLHK